MTQFKDFITTNLRVLIVIVSFVVTFYVQHVINTQQIATLKCQVYGIGGKR